MHSRTLKDVTVEYYVLAIGDQAMEDPIGKYMIGEEVHVVAGLWHGYSGEEYPAWMEYGFHSPKKFDNAEAALEFANSLERRGRVNIRPGSLTVYRTASQTIREEVTEIVGQYQ